jgi:O-acetyl-ADP-ribose deacetylase (regulator of RNase III)
MTSLKLNKMKGDLIKLSLEGQFDFIVHGCNCFHAMKSGIAGQIAKTFPLAVIVDKHTRYGDRAKLGSWSVAPALSRSGKTFLIINAYTQYTYSRTKDVFEYDAFDKFLKSFGAKLVAESEGQGKRVGFPKIGCGLAGGDEAAILGKLEAFAESMERHGVQVSLVEWSKGS